MIKFLVNFWMLSLFIIPMWIHDLVVDPGVHYVPYDRLTGEGGHYESNLYGIKTWMLLIPILPAISVYIYFRYIESIIDKLKKKLEKKV